VSGDDGAGEARVDRALASLARDVPPDRDLWPAIAAGLEPRRVARRWLPLAAAAVLLGAASSLITATLVRRAEGPVAARPEAAPAAPGVQRAAFGPRHALDSEYAEARQQLASMLAQRIDRLPSSARQKLEDNLAVLHRASDEINAALALQPGDPLLEELLLNTYQDELAVLASVNQLTNLNGATVPEDTRIKL
jgi:hypothetical protein